MNAFAALERVETAGAETLFCGHTHQPYVRELSGGSIRVSVQQSGNEQASEQEMTLPMRRIVMLAPSGNLGTAAPKPPTSSMTTTQAK